MLPQIVRVELRSGGKLRTASEETPRRFDSPERPSDCVFDFSEEVFVATSVLLGVKEGAFGEPLRRLDDLSHLVGNTPLLEIHLEYRGEPRVLYAKYEALNMTGSIKDRMVVNILRHGYEDGLLKPGDTIVEATSGSTGISCASIGRAMGHPVTIFMPDWMSRERSQLIRSLGAEIVPITSDQGGLMGSIRQCERFAAENRDVFLPRQFANPANLAAHVLGTGPEIEEQLRRIGRRPDAFVAAVGTGGTVMGVGRYLRRKNPKVRVYPVEPKESPTLTTGYKAGSHRIQGVSDEFIPALVKLDELDEVLSISDGDSILLAQKLAVELGLGVGISSGCNLLAALEAQDRLGASATVVTILCDDNKKYLSTDLCRDEPVRPEYTSPHVRFTGFRSLPRCF
ncbi:MAG: cysteine synthase family protein [Acidobacteriota bacterium]|nr:cysteine synthase family protein [Acidobacteriota bacterium]